MATGRDVDLAVARLAASGLEHIGLGPLYIVPMGPEETAASSPNFAPASSMKIQYMDPRSPHLAAQPLRHRPMWPGFYRIRYTDEILPVDGRGKPRRYDQPTGAGVCAYFPPIIDWNIVLDDPLLPIVITEGELKAAKATSMGFPTIGLGGVSNTVSRKTGYDFLPELQSINWVQRDVYICFDNDGQPKPDVLMAINRLALQLEQLGAVPWLVRLPDHPKGLKMGLDDYFLSGYGTQDFRLLLSQRESLTMAREMWKLNERCIKVMDPMCVIDSRTDTLLKVDSFKSHFGNIRVPEQLLTRDGEMSYKLVPVSERWLAWTYRLSVDGIIYEPGKDRFVEGKYNMWKGWGAEPKKGSVKLLERLLDYIFGDTKEGKRAKRWFIQWLAYPIQHPGAKLYTSALLWSHAHGTGKTLLGYLMGRIYGDDNFTEITQKHMHGDFNAWAQNKQFILGDEITGSDKRELADQVKTLITQEKIRINQKHMPEFTLRNVCNFLLTSNRATALYLEDDDRRFFVWEVLSKAPLEFFREFDAWYKSEEGVAAALYYFLHVDLTGFEPFEPAPMTEAKQRMAEDGLSAHGSWCRRLKNDPDFYLRIGKAAVKGDLFTSAELLQFYKQEEPMTPVKAGTFGMELKAAGFKQLPLVRWGTPERRDRFYIVRNEQGWVDATPAKIKRHVEHRGDKS